MPGIHRGGQNVMGLFCIGREIARQALRHFAQQFLIAAVTHQMHKRANRKFGCLIGWDAMFRQQQTRFCALTS